MCAVIDLCRKVVLAWRIGDDMWPCEILSVNIGLP